MATTTPGVRWKGINTLAKRLKVDLPASVQRHLFTAIEKTTEQIVAEAKRRVPVRTGELRKSIALSMSRKRLLGQVGIRKGSPARRYWHLVEFGSVNAPAHPFFRPSIERAKPDHLARLRDAGRGVERDLSSGRLG